MEGGGADAMPHLVAESSITLLNIEVTCGDLFEGTFGGAGMSK